MSKTQLGFWLLLIWGGFALVLVALVITAEGGSGQTVQADPWLTVTAMQPYQTATAPLPECHPDYSVPCFTRTPDTCGPCYVFTPGPSPTPDSYPAPPTAEPPDPYPSAKSEKEPKKSGSVFNPSDAGIWEFLWFLFKVAG